MNENKRNRRRFLADILFAGTAMTGAAFLAQSVQGKTPEASATPKRATPSPNHQAVPGEMVAPRPPETKLGGKPTAPKQCPPPALGGAPMPPRPTPPPTPKPPK